MHGQKRGILLGAEDVEGMREALANPSPRQDHLVVHRRLLGGKEGIDGLDRSSDLGEMGDVERLLREGIDPGQQLVSVRHDVELDLSRPCPDQEVEKVAGGGRLLRHDDDLQLLLTALSNSLLGGIDLVHVDSVVVEGTSLTVLLSSRGNGDEARMLAELQERSALVASLLLYRNVQFNFVA